MIDLESIIYMISDLTTTIFVVTNLIGAVKSLIKVIRKDKKKV